MKKLTKTHQDQIIKQLHDYWINPITREIWIHGREFEPDGSGYTTEPGVEYGMATRVIKNLHILKHLDKKKPVTIHLHTCGGDWREGLAIYDTIKLMPYKTKIISYTHARSMSSIILQAGDERLMLPNSIFMFHDGTQAIDGEVRTVESEIEFYKYERELMLDIYVEACSGSKKFELVTDAQIRKHFKDLMNKKGDVFLKAEEAVVWGFADGIIKKI